MTTRREYAASLGLAKANSRGRLSKAAHDAIDKAIADGMTFDEPIKPEPKPKPAKAVSPPKPKPVKIQPEKPTPLSMPRPTAPIRDARAYVATTFAGQVIEFGSCGRCKNHVSWCRCKSGPTPPAWVAGEVESWVAVPKA